MGRVTARRRATRLTADTATKRAETLAVEEPLEIRLNGTPLTVTMRTPGADVELAQGFLLTEGVIGDRDDVAAARYCSSGGADGSGLLQNTYNVLDVTLAPGVPMPEEDVRRRFDRSRRHFLEDYLPLADEWGLWDNAEPPPRQIADSKTHTFDQLQAMLSSSSLQEAPPTEMSEMSKIVLEAGRVATEKMLDYYRRMGIRVTPQMTLAPQMLALSQPAHSQYIGAPRWKMENTTATSAQGTIVTSRYSRNSALRR